MKHAYTLTAALLACSLTLCPAEEKPIKYDKLLEYTNVTVTKVTPDSISIIHQNGTTRIPFEKLPEDVRRDLGMSDETVEAHRQKLEDDAIRQEEQREMRKLEEAASQLLFSRVSGRILQVLDEGALLTDAKQWMGMMKKDSYFDATEYATVTLHSAYQLPVGICYLQCSTAGLVDGQDLSRVVAAAGRYSYVNALNVQKTVAAFTTDLERACRSDPRIAQLSSENIIRLTETRLDVAKMFSKTKKPLKPQGRK